MARARIPGIGSGGVNRAKAALAKTKPKASKAKATFVGKSKAKSGRKG